MKFAMKGTFLAAVTTSSARIVLSKCGGETMATVLPPRELHANVATFLLEDAIDLVPSGSNQPSCFRLSSLRFFVLFKWFSGNGSDKVTCLDGQNSGDGSRIIKGESRTSSPRDFAKS